MSPLEPDALYHVAADFSVVFIAAFSGNLLYFEKNAPFPTLFANSLVKALIVASFISGLWAFDYLTADAYSREWTEFLWFKPTFFSTVLVFAVAFLANLVFFSNRLVNALLAAGFVAVLEWAVIYFTGDSLATQMAKIA